MGAFGQQGRERSQKKPQLLDLQPRSSYLAPQVSCCFCQPGLSSLARCRCCVRRRGRTGMSEPQELSGGEWGPEG